MRSCSDHDRHRSGCRGSARVERCGGSQDTGVADGSACFGGRRRCRRQRRCCRVPGGSSAGAQQVTSTQRACQQWAAGYSLSAGTAPTGGWCTAMTGWMREQLHGGHITGPMTWNDATSMRNTCRSWMAKGPPAASGVSPQACDDMVVWMAEHAGSWSSWSAAGHMMASDRGARQPTRAPHGTLPGGSSCDCPAPTRLCRSRRATLDV